ncbi:MAG: hypothetical protein ACERKZ_16260 [Lachnotalea sp.]
MKSTKNLLEEILEEIGIKEKIQFDDICTDRLFLNKLNKYFYQKNGEYISEFHQYWEANYEEILNISINYDQAYIIAKKFNEIFSDRVRYSCIEISPKINKEGLTPENIANIRFFTTIQDFKINIYKKGRDPFQQFLINPEWFDAEKIANNDTIIYEFINYLDATGSQGDKRKKWMKDAANFLIERCHGSAFDIFKTYNEDVLKIRNILADGVEIGFSRKKVDMFLRDMVDWKVWKATKNIECLNVASDSNTMRIALRTGLLEPAIPLLASYLDIFSYQYGMMDSMTQAAWRVVWELWEKIPNNTCPTTPAAMDYMIYKSIGKANCFINARKCNRCIMNDICPMEKRNLKPPKSISIKGMTGWESGITDEGGGGGIMA